MEFKFGKEPTHDESQSQPVPQEKGRQTGLLILLLVLVGGFGYLYFFTGMIRPQEQPPAPTPPPQVLKQPLPTRDAAPPATIIAEQKPAAAPAASTPPAPVPPAKPQQPSVASTAAVPAVKPQEAKPVSAKAPETTKPVPAAAKPQEAVKTSVQAPKAEQPKPVAAKNETKAVVAKPAAKPEAKPAAADPLKSASADKKTVAKAVAPWTVVVGYYVVEEALAADMAKVKRAGLSPVMTSGPKRPVTMHRLYVGEYGSRAEGQQVLASIQQIGGTGFLVQRGEKYDLFAGSYAMQSGANAEQQRLAAANIKTTIRKVQVSLASRKLSAGTFTDRKAAEAAVKKLKDAAVGSPVLE